MKKETLEEGLNKSANKRGFTGKDRKRYIGGALENLAKKGKIKLKRSPPPKRGKPREIITLVVKKNSAASATRGYDVFSIYKQGVATPYNSSTFRKRAVANRSALDEMHAHNSGLKQNRFKG